MIYDKTISILAVLSLLAAQCPAQTVPQVVEKPHGPLLIRSYRPASTSPINLTNSDHLHSLIRAGHLYLTVQDAIALAIENNLDLEVDRYGPLGARMGLRASPGRRPVARGHQREQPGESSHQRPGRAGQRGCSGPCDKHYRAVAAAAAAPPFHRSVR